MSGINNFLADLYGNPNGFEKQASGLTQSDLEVWDAFTKLAASDGIDVDQLDDSQIDALYDHYSGAEADGDVEFPPNWDQDDVNHFVELDEDGREQFAQYKEAEFLGEVIAHSQFSTLRKLAEAEMEKEAVSLNPMPLMRRGRDLVVGGAKGVDSGAQRLGQYIGGKSHSAGTSLAKRRVGRLESRIEKATKSEKDKSKLIEKLTGKLDAGRARMGKGLEPMSAGRARALGYAAGTAGIGGVGGAGYGAYSMGKAKGRREKNAYAIEAEAEARAIEFLKMAGIDVDDGEDDYINERAAEMLIDSGYGELLEY